MSNELEVGERIKKYLEFKGISQTHVADKTEIDFKRFNGIMNGHLKVHAEEYYFICNYLNVPMESFLKKSKFEKLLDNGRPVEV